MNILRSIIMAFSVFSRLPMPTLRWRQDRSDYTLAALPLVGVVVGLLQWAWAALCAWLGFGTLISAAGFVFVPLFFSGGIHLDGFADTADALGSHADAEKKQAILKDPHLGAFALFATVVYLLFYAALGSELITALSVGRIGLTAGIAAVFARVLGALASVLHTPSKGEGLQAAFNQTAGRASAAVLLVSGAAVWVAAGLLFGVIGAAACLVAALGYFYVTRRVAKKFGGMSGDLAGYLICLSELGWLASFVVLTKIGGLF